MKMQAIVLEQFGGVEHLNKREWTVPDPGPEEVRVRIRAASVNPVDFKIRKGFLGGQPPMVLGVDLSGVVDAVGDGVTGFSPGDPVWGFVDPEGPASNGSHAEYVTVHHSHLAHKPKNFSDPEAAGMAMVGLTAYQALVQKARVQKGEAVFIAGGAGAVGAPAIQIARHLGADPILTTAGSDHSAAYLTETLGVPPEHILHYPERSLAEMGDRLVEMNNGHLIPAAFDFVGGDMKRLCLEVIDFDGRITTIVEESEDFRLHAVTGGKSPLLGKAATFHAVLVLARSRFATGEYWSIYGEQLTELARLIDDGVLSPHRIRPVDGFTADAFRAAHTEMETRHPDGKLVATIPD
jgi:NADPH2:quinone reductase